MIRLISVHQGKSLLFESMILLVYLISVCPPSLAQASESTFKEGDRRELISYCYVRQGYELKLAQESAQETKRNLTGMKETVRKDVDRLLIEHIRLNERRLEYLRGLLDANGIDPNRGSSLQKYDRLVLDDLRSDLHITKEDRCRRNCFIDTVTSLSQIEQFEICAKKCSPINVTDSTKRARACQTLYVNLR